MWLKTYLLVTGIGAFLALAFPGLVVFGLFLLVIPGLVLAMMPTAFLYGLVFAAMRFVLGAVLTGIPLNIAAAVATGALMWAIPQPMVRQAKARLAALRQDEVLPPAPVALSGHILIVRPFESRCDSLCAALLRTPGVSSVRIETRHGHSYTYRLGDADMPGRHEKPVGHGLLEPAEYKASDPLARQRALEAEWNLMLTERGLKLIRSDDAPPADFTIAISDGLAGDDQPRVGKSLDWSLAAAPVGRKALELFGRDGMLLMRQELLSTSAPSAPLSIGAEGGIENFRFRWARKRIGDGTQYAEIPVEQLLMDHTSVARGVDLGAADRRTRAELEAALADPARPAGDPAFGLANQWMESHRAVKGPLDQGERALLAQILADPRVISANGLWAVVKRLDEPAPDLRRLAARRYLASAKPHDARGWINAFATLPPGSYAEELPEERMVLAAPERSQYATGLIRRQGDRGVAAVPDLLHLLRQYCAHDPGEYGYGDLTEAMSAVRSGFRVIGPDAAFACDEIEALLATPVMARRYEIARQDWDVLLVVLGRPVETIDKPQRLSGTVAGYRKRIADLAAREFDPSQN